MRGGEKGTQGFTDRERASIRERAGELKAEARPDKSDGERDVLAKIAEMTGADRAVAEQLHAIIRAGAPTLSPKLWYGQPAYAEDGKVVCFFRGAEKDGVRYLTLGFSDRARLDEGRMWPTAYAVTDATAEAARIGALVKKAVG